MDESFFKYLQQLELIGFFTGYPVLYAAVIVISGKQKIQKTFISRMAPLLPFAYALTGTLYFGLQLKNLYPDYSFQHIKQSIQIPWLVLWGLSAMLFWLPVFSKRRVLSLLHSLVVFFILVKEVFVQLSGQAGNTRVLSNDMHVYTDSIFLNLACFAAVLVAVYLALWLKKIF